MSNAKRTELAENLRQHLLFLYGEAGNAWLPRFLSLVDGLPGRPSRPASARVLTERDAILITYAGQVREEGIPPLQTLAGVCENHLQDVVSAVHLLPFYPSTSDDGFSVADYFEVDANHGTWDDVTRLGRSFDLMFDAVFNHMSAQSEWFRRFLADDPEFREFFVTVTGTPDLSGVIRPRALPLLTEFPSATGPRQVWTTFSADQVDVNAANPQVVFRLVEALLFYVQQGARFIRLDAIAYLWKEIGTPCIHLPRTHRIIQLFRTVLDLSAPEVVLITETNVPHVDNISYFGDGTNEAQLVYNFALPPLVLHSLATGNAEKLTHWAQGLQPPSRQTAFFNFLSSHDGIGINPARGILSAEEIHALVQRATDHGGFVSYKFNSDGSRSPYELNINYFDALSNPSAEEPETRRLARFLSAHAIQLSLAGVPGIYFHSLFGSRNDRAGAEASGIPRRINREKLSLESLQAALRQPESLRSRVFDGLRRLLEVRRHHAGFHPQAPQQILALDPRVFAVQRTTPDGASRVLCLHNVANTPVTMNLEESQSARDLLTGTALPRAANNRLLVSLAPYQTFWLEFH